MSEVSGVKSLVLVLGAGASKEVGLPIGDELKSAIARLLDIRLEAGIWQIGGDPHIIEALHIIAAKETGANNQVGDIGPLLKMCWRIKDAMPQAISIDNFIDCHAKEPMIAVCGKLAIAKAILLAENGSALKVGRHASRNYLEYSKISKTWFNALFQLLTENCRLVDLPDRLRSVGLIIFNYDRCFEHYLFYAVQNYYGVDASVAADMLKCLEIHHPYGMVGALPWMRQPNSIDFGADVGAEGLLSVSQQLRTFSEGTDRSVSDIDSIRSGIANAKRLLFLGFAFHRLNMEVLFGEAGAASMMATERVFASAFGISSSDCNAITNELGRYTSLLPLHIHVRNELTCTTLFQEYKRGLSLV